MDLSLSVITPPSPAFGKGNIEWVQIITPHDDYVNGATGETMHDPLNGITGLDTSYGGQQAQSEYFGVFNTGDSPI